MTVSGSGCMTIAETPADDSTIICILVQGASHTEREDNITMWQGMDAQHEEVG